jgi:lysozyme
MKLENDQLIKNWEELRLEAYLPTPNDEWTIGWGHTHGVEKGDVITKAQAQSYFDADVAWAEAAVNKSVKVGLTQHQFDALVSFVFNIGETDFKTSTLLRKLNAGDYEGAANELPRWKYQKGEVLRGLVRRRAEEMEYFLEPENGPSSAKPDAVDPLKSMALSKELIGSAGAILAGGGAFIGSVDPEAQKYLSVAVSVLLVGFGVFFMVNRILARKRGDR